MLRSRFVALFTLKYEILNVSKRFQVIAKFLVSLNGLLTVNR